METKEIIVDLWPKDIGLDFELGEAAMLIRLQAECLTKKTGGIVSGLVKTVTDNNNYIIDSFYVYSPSLGYKHLLFEITYKDLSKDYPVYIKWDATRGTMKSEKSINSLDELTEELIVVFSYPKTLRVIKAILGRSK